MPAFAPVDRAELDPDDVDVCVVRVELELVRSGVVVVGGGVDVVAEDDV